MNINQKNKMDEIIAEGVSSYVYQQRIKEKLLILSQEVKQKEQVTTPTVINARTKFKTYYKEVAIVGLLLLIGAFAYFNYAPSFQKMQETATNNSPNTVIEKKIISGPTNVSEDANSSKGIQKPKVPVAKKEKNSNKKAEEVPLRKNKKTIVLEPIKDKEIKEKPEKITPIAAKDEDEIVSSKVLASIEIPVPPIESNLIGKGKTEKAKNDPMIKDEKINRDSLWSEYYKQKKYDEVIKLLPPSSWNELLKKPIDNIRLAVCYLKKKQPNQAIAIELLNKIPLEESNGRYSYHNEVYLFLTIAHLQENNIKKAKEILAKFNFEAAEEVFEEEENDASSVVYEKNIYNTAKKLLEQLKIKH